MRLKQISYLFLISISLSFLASCGSKKQALSFSDVAHPKREFRGAWMSTAWQSRYREMLPEQTKAFFVESLNQLQKDGINAIIFQVRPQADAFYKSKYEPWSAHLTGMQGLAPRGDFDPLAFLIKECHKRNIELHAWLNPYRVTTNKNDLLASNHLYNRFPERFLNYDGKIYFDPGIPKNRDFINKVVKDILLKYDVDAIHMDDYFYPYPIAGKEFPDEESFEKYGRNFTRVTDWRRNNVNLLVKEIKETITEVKPWVRFGISPFGIYRNKKSTPDGSGSNTNGLQNYDDLYADVKLWVKKGWIDYNMPQIYWEIGHSAADYTTLLKWWAENNHEQHLYIGQDVKRSMNATNSVGKPEIDEKMRQMRNTPNVHGNCFWPAYELLDNYKDVEQVLRKNYHRYPALIPAYTHMSNEEPKKVEKLKSEYTPTSHILHWQSNHDTNNPLSAQYYVVYRFDKKEKENLENARKIVAITRETFYELPYEKGQNEYKYIVTAVDGFHNESKGQKKKVKI